MAYNSAYTGPQVDAAVGAVQSKESTWDGKQDKLTGQSGQVVGFDEEGNAVAQTPPETGDVKADGSVPMTGDLNMGGHRITNVSAPAQPTDAVRQSDLKTVSDEVDGIISGATPIILPPATTTKIGGVIVGDGIEVEEDGTISTNPVPEGGTEGQMLYQGGNGPEWGDKPVMYVNITESGGTYSADKTFAEIESAIESEYSVVANVKEGNEESEIGFILPLAYFASGVVVLFALYLNGFFYSAAVAPNNFASYSKVRIPAKNISFTPTSTVTADNVQEAIEEVYTKTAPTHQTITLSSSAWSSNSQTVTVSGVTADELDQLITPTPAIASQSAYYEAGIMCTGQAANRLTFTCQTVPTSNLTVYVVIQPLS